MIWKIENLKSIKDKFDPYQFRIRLPCDKVEDIQQWMLYVKMPGTILETEIHEPYPISTLYLHTEQDAIRIVLRWA